MYGISLGCIQVMVVKVFEKCLWIFLYYPTYFTVVRRCISKLPLAIKKLSPKQHSPKL